ncbi:MAG TPA: GntG family PLP-dependent aldolase [Gaiellaceae bacterium]|nr:GntG family PLP-dependent aldolase [Gaiellaceae bacterium]
MVDLRSDTLTQPTRAMREAIANAVVGDEQKREDPTVLELERRGAELLGHEEAVFLPTASMANQIALRILSEPGDELLADAHSHVFLYEQGGPAVHAGLVMKPLRAVDGRFDPETVRAAWQPATTHTARTRLVSIENTNNSAGGRVWPVDEVAEVARVARELDLRLHLDGARLMNAAVAAGAPASEYGRHFDTVTLCLSKGLGCPLGALLAGSSELMAKARRGKHLFGGAMRQAGIVAAAGLHALDHHVERLADDHARARRLAEAWHAAGLAVRPECVETNFVQLDVAPLDISRQEAIERMEREGVRLSVTIHPTVLRAVTHLDVGDEQVEHACEAVPRALGLLASV